MPRAKKKMKRRRFLKAIPAAVAAGIAVPTLAQQGEQAPRLGKETLDCAEKIFGVDFTEQQEEQALNGVNRNLDAYERLRGVDIPLDTEPAVTFRPYLPGKKPKAGATPGAKINVRLQAPAARAASLDDLAFLPVTALAPLVQRRDVSSTDLTKMYLERLKKHGARLNVFVTLTEELALAQAAQADREIKSGKYRGPLHGIPWGAKDLFATKGIPTTFGAGPYQNQVIDYDATIVERLREAGAVLVAKLSLGALAQGDRLVPRADEEPVESGRSAARRLQRLVGRSRVGDGCRAGRFRDRHRDAWLDHFPFSRQRRRRPAPDLRAHQPLRRDGAELDDGQDRPDVPVGRGLCAGVQRDLRSRRTRRYRRRCAVHVASGRPAVQAEDWLHQGGVRAAGTRRGSRRRAW